MRQICFFLFVPDTFSFPTEELKDFDEYAGNACEAQEAEKDWERIALAFLHSGEAEDKAAAAAKVPKLFRRKSFDLCCAWDNILKLCNGQGLSMYVDERFKLLYKKCFVPTWPLESAPKHKDWLWVVQDRCATNLSPVTYLTYHHGCMLNYFGDPNHDPWNEVKNAGSECGLSDIFKVTMMVANTLFGPCDSAGFWQQSLDASVAYKKRLRTPAQSFNIIYHALQKT